jgi:DNA mismatch repair protein MutL
MSVISPPFIRVLDGETVNRIAAGEVVERPASIVKELVENAIDAGAASISVDITTGGKEITRIRISDNGCGIPAGEVHLAFLPHATSKISTAEDLHSCMTLGFRGEALASIAAIAYVTMVTRYRDEEAGSRIIVSGGEVLEHGAAGSPKGTTLTVEEIFFTTPARRKFLRSLATELSRVSSVVEAFSLLYPELTFRYSLNGQEKSSSHGGRTLGEVLRALRPDEAGKMIPVLHDEAGIRIEGFISHPSLIRQNPQRILIAVNGRHVISPQINGAIRKGYGTLIPSHTFPVAVLLLSLDPGRVDANIHPAKREIRISGDSEIFSHLIAAVRDALHGSDLTHPAFREETQEQIPRSGSPTFHPDPFRYRSSETPSRRVAEATLAGYRTTARQLRQTRLVADASDTAGDPGFPSLTYIGQAGATYLVASTPEGDLYLIDQHAAHERVRYDQLKKDQEEGTLSQELLVPVILPLTRPEADQLADLIPCLEEEGFLIEAFGKDTWCVRGVPVVLGRCEDSEAIREIVTGALGEGSEAGIRESVSRMVACRGAVKAGVILTPDQGEEIIRQLSRTAEPYTCPHGRPTIVSFSKFRLEELFRRR